MNEQEQAWNRELDVLRTVIGSALGPGDDDPAQHARDIEQTALGVLLVSTLPPPAFDAALRHLRMECERRGVKL